MYREDEEQEGWKEEIKRGPTEIPKLTPFNYLYIQLNAQLVQLSHIFLITHPHPILIHPTHASAPPRIYTCHQVFLSTTHLQTCCLPVRFSVAVFLPDISWYHLGPSLATNHTRLIHRVTSGNAQNPDSIIRESSRWRRPISDPFHGHDTNAICTRLSAIARLVLCAQHTLGLVRGSFVSSKLFGIKCNDSIGVLQLIRVDVHTCESVWVSSRGIQKSLFLLSKLRFSCSWSCWRTRMEGYRVSKAVDHVRVKPK